MSDDGKESKNKIGCGCSSFGVVLLIGLICTLLGVGVGIGATVRVPLTEANASIAGAIGKKELVQGALPNYLRDKIADNTNFINHTGTLTIWFAEGIDIVVIGNQPGAPVVDFNITITREAASSSE